MLKLPAINFDGDSSEEDEDITTPTQSITQSGILSGGTIINKLTKDEPHSAMETLSLVPNTSLNSFKNGKEERLTSEDSFTPFLSDSAIANAQMLLSLVRGVSMEDDEEEEDEPLPAFVAPVIDYGSPEFVEAQRSIENDPWDINSWIAYMEEVEDGRSGRITAIEAYQKFLQQFPRSSRYWRLYAEYYIQKEDYSMAEEVFRKCLVKCRSVGLWQSYLEMIRKKTIDRTSKYSDNYLKERDTYKLAFTKALENIGLSLESKIIWRKYIDFIKDWPEVTDLDKGRKLNALREVYRRAICIPTDEIDQYWKEYETLEKQVGGDNQHLADQILQDYQQKYTHAKVIERERRRIAEKIELDRLARPPQHSSSEMVQLDAWNRWIRYELTNPGNLSVPEQQEMMALVYDQCLCCLRHHPEIWMSLAKNQGDTAGVNAARVVYREAIEVIPDVAILRLALAELEERNGNIETVRDILQQAFQQLQTPFTFAILQRFIRRVDGKQAARKCFSDTYPLRMNSSLGHEVYMAHATIELDVNQEPDVSLKIMELAKISNPQCVLTASYVQLLSRIYVRLGDLTQCRWVFTTALLSKDSPLTLREKYELWEDFLQIEISLGLSDIKRLDEVRSCRDQTKLALEEHDKHGSADTSERLGVFDKSLELLERYSGLVPTLPKADGGLRDRARALGLSGTSEADNTRAGDSRVSVDVKKKIKRDENPINPIEIAFSSGPALPPFLKDLLSKLPPHSGASPDVDGFIDQLRRAVLPPRPIEEQESATAEKVATKKVVPDTDGDRKRFRDDVVQDEDGYYESSHEGLDEGKGDIFRQRQRQKLFHT